MARRTKLSANDHEREFLKYLPPLVFRPHVTDSIPTSSVDITLTALAQLGTLRLNASRSFISLFDKAYQYILAEATPTLSLQDDEIHDKGDSLWFGTAILHRHASPCSWLVEQRVKASLQRVADLDAVTVIPDLWAEDGIKASDFASKAPPPRFYVGVPLRSPRGAIIGSYCVLDDIPRVSLDPTQIQFLKDMATTVMSHLVLSRMREEYRQGERMIRGIGSFVEGRSTLRDWRATTGDNEISYEPPREYHGGEGQLDVRQQSLQSQDHHSSDYFSTVRPDAHSTTESEGIRIADRTAESPSLSNRFSLPISMNGFSATPMATSAYPNSRLPAMVQSDIYNVHSRLSVTTPDFPSARAGRSALSQSTMPTLSRAANVIRESLEVEGTVFYRSNARSEVQSNIKLSNSSICTGASTGDDIATPSSTDTDTSHSSEIPEEKCKVLAHSESYNSSINNEPPSSELSYFLAAFLESLYLRYPRGKIFHFDTHGSLSSGSSGDESPAMAVNTPCGPTPGSDQTEERQQEKTKAVKKIGKRKNGSKMRPRDGAMLLKCFPGARSVGFFPLWDSHQKKWYAGGFIWTKQPNRSFTIEGQMSFCNAIGSAIMADVVRLDALNSDRAKTELLGSISHELRSPLHGILGSVELLGGLPHTEFQADMIQSIEACGRTLLDTIEQLLDFSKINHLAQQKKQMMFRSSMHDPESRLRRGDPATRLDVITEEVVTAVAVGHNAHTHTSLRFEEDSPIGIVPDSRSTVIPEMSEDAARTSKADPGLAIDLHIDKSMDMAFNTNPGAWRRIVMNLFANSLKYTAAGHVKISLSARPAIKKPKGSLYKVQLTITDTGAGISAEYLRDRLFKPFSQENDLASGTGLGLSIVKQIVDSQNGKISVKSTPGIGTKISVSMCMEKDQRISPDDEDDSTSVQIGSFAQRTQGTIACLISSSSSSEATENPNHSRDNIELGASLKKTCQDWFGLTLCSESERQARECSMFFVFDPDLLQVESILGKIRSLSPKLESNTNGILFIIFRSLYSSQKFLAASQKMLAEYCFVQPIIQPFGIQKLVSSISRGLDLQCHKATSQVAPDIPSSTSDQTDSAISSLKTPPKETNCLPSPLSTPKELAGSTNNGLLAQTSSSEPMTLERFKGNKKEPPGFQQASPHLIHGRTTDSAILIVDDNAINVKILATHVKRHNIPFLTAQNGQEALDIYTSSPATYRTILMDISMPVMDGLASTRAIRRLEKLQGLEPSTVIIVTGLADAVVQQETQASGADAYLAKPVRLKELDKVMADLRK